MMENKIAIVTGADGNLGQAVIRKFIAEAFHVTGTVINNTIPPPSFSEDEFESAVVDLTNEAATQTFIESVISKHKKIDAAILTAGGFAMGNVENTKLGDVQRQYKLNFETAYNTARPIFLQMMRQDSGRLFLIGSKPGLSAKEGKGKIAYSLSKSLIFRLAELMNEEAKGRNVVVNVVVPGTIDTPQNRESMPDADFSKWTKASSIADVIYWHCTEEAASLREGIIKVYNYA
jgi:NAD(P)-dependent dehydrogenase (short-subunit alcohol dehydrogenase family)